MNAKDDSPRNAYSRETVNIAELARGEKLISGMTFDRCLIRGPAYLKFQTDNRVEYPSVPNDPVQSFLTLSEGAPIHGAILLARTLFRYCHFENITFVGTQADNKPAIPQFTNMPTAEWRRKEKI